MEMTKELLKKLVSIPSAHPNEKEMAVFLEKELKKRGFKTQRQPVGKNRFNVLGELGNSKTCVLFYGHMDTVEPCKGWKSDPYELLVKNDRAYGLGSNDMKGGIVSILKALEGIKTNDLKIKVAFAVDEENISEGADVLVKSGWLNDVDFSIIPEIATSGTSSNEPNLITLGRRGRVAFKITVLGRAAHGAQPELGINAIEDASKIILALENIKLAKHEKLGKASVCPLSLICTVKTLSVPDTAEILVDRHLVPPETKTFVLKQMRELIAKLNLRSEVKVEFVNRKTQFLMPYFTPENDKFVQVASGVVKEHYNNVMYSYGLSVGDENYFGARLGIPSVVIGPKGGNAHCSNEWVSLQSIQKLTDIYTEILNRVENGFHKK